MKTTLEQTIQELISLKSEILNRAKTCVKGENYVIVTKDYTVTVLNQGQYNTNFLISFPAECSEKQFNQMITEYRQFCNQHPESWWNEMDVCSVDCYFKCLEYASEREQMKRDALSKKRISIEEAISFACLVDSCLGDGLNIEKGDPIHKQCIDLIIKASGKQL